MEVISKIFWLRFSLVLTSTLVMGEPSGHLQPLGSHASGIEIEARDTVPNPIEFFNDYLKPGKPLIIRNAAKSLKNFDLWKDDAYLREKYGDWVFMVEVGKYEGSVFGKTLPINFRHFIDIYQKKPIYIIQDIVHDNPLREDMSLLNCMSCGGYKNYISEVMLFFSSGSTESALHRDDYENLHCLLDGTKEWIVYDRNVTHLIPPMENEPSYGAMNCKSVDMLKYPIMQQLPWYHAFLNAGDCFYLPWGWMHNVRSSDSRNMAIAVWFGPIHHLTRLEECPDDFSELPVEEPIPKVPISHAAELRILIWKLFPEGVDVLSTEDFLTAALEFSNASSSRTVFDLVDLNKDGYLTLNELDDLPDEIAKEALDRPQKHYVSIQSQSRNFMKKQTPLSDEL